VKLLEKHTRDPQIILIWSLDFLRIFENYLRLVWIKHKKKNKPCWKISRVPQLKVRGLKVILRLCLQTRHKNTKKNIFFPLDKNLTSQICPYFRNELSLVMWTRLPEAQAQRLNLEWA